jgi:hypothetical protein
MKVLNYIVILPFVVLLFFGCRKKEVIKNELPYIPPYWDHFYGTYSFVDTSDNSSYTMKIEQISREFIPETYYIKDSMVIKNYANMFDLYLSFEIKNNQTNILYTGLIDGLTDKNGKRWFYTGNQDDANTTFQENVLLPSNEIYIYFKIDNANYWSQDMTTYFSGYIKHKGTKLN